MFDSTHTSPMIIEHRVGVDPRLRGMHQLVGRGVLLGSENLEGWIIWSLSGGG